MSFSCCGRFVQYKATSLEKQHKHELLTEPDLGVTIDLINPDTYRIDPSSKFQVVAFPIPHSIENQYHQFTMTCKFLHFSEMNTVRRSDV